MEGNQLVTAGADAQTVVDGTHAHDVPSLCVTAAPSATAILPSSGSHPCALSSCLSHFRTLHLAVWTAGTVMCNSSAMSVAERPSTATPKKAFTVLSSNLK